MIGPSMPLIDARLVFSVEKGRRERFDFYTGTNGHGGRAVEVRLMVLNGARWPPTAHAFRHRADLAAAFAEGYATVAAGFERGNYHG